MTPTISSFSREIELHRKSGLAPSDETDQIEEVHFMLKVTSKAATVLKAAKRARGASAEAGIRIVRGPGGSGNTAPAIGFTISEAPGPNDEEIDQDGLSIFVESALVEPLDGRTLDVRDEEGQPELVFR
jgi:Fe-S cluster assembly iron-binding protein IscA